MYPGAHVAQFPDKPAVLMASSGECLTYRELDAGSARLARYLYEHGLRRGDHIALLTDNHPTAFEVYWAALRSGLYITAVNWHLLPDEISYIVNDCGAQALIVSGALEDTAAALVDSTPGVRVRMAYGAPVENYLCYTDELRNISALPLPVQPRGAEMLYSSGTTGRPKGIKAPLPDTRIHEHDETTARFGQLYGLGPQSIYLSTAPLYHTAPLRSSGWVHGLGGTVVVMERFDPEQALASIERFRVTHSQWVPTMFVRMLKLDSGIREKFDLTSQQIAIHAAAPCPVDVKRAMIDWWGPILMEYYGATEAHGMTLINSEESLDKPGSVGRAVVGTLHVCDDSGRELPHGETGTVFFERDEPAFAYHNDPAKTDDARHPRHSTWCTTGDIGHMDADGYLFLTDRKSFVVISGGVNIYPQEIENALALHPKVLDVAVVGVPDADMGEVVKAFVQPALDVSGSAELAKELRAYLSERIARYKVPRSVAFVEELPRTPTGKLVKGRLRIQAGVDGDQQSLGTSTGGKSDGERER
ncbi:acyl-CoA synthetase [Nocardia sp. NPDC055029]